MDLKAKLSKMSSPALIVKLLVGNMQKKEATIIATIMECRFPTPPNILSMKQKSKIKVA